MLVLPYGSAFPLEAWPAIRELVKQGGGLVVLGGAPFHQPVRREKAGEGTRYVLGPRQPTYAHELLIGPSDELDAASFAGPVKAVAVAGSEWDGALPEPKRTWALTVRLATREDMPGEGGTAGPRDGVLRPLVHLWTRRASRGCARSSRSTACAGPSRALAGCSRPRTPASTPRRSGRPWRGR